MQAGIHALANMEVDQNEIFWVDRGLRKPICANETNVDTNVVEYHCHDPVPPRLMAAKKDEPRATERVVLTDFDGRRPLLGARHVYWLGAGGVHRVPKAGGDNAAGAADARAVGLRRRRRRRVLRRRRRHLSCARRRGA